MDYPNSGALWPNKKRETEKHPNVTGDIKIERSLLKELMAESDEELIAISLSGWTKEYKEQKYISLKASKPFKKTGYKPTQDNDDDLPF
jgi:hypothetical protein